MSNGMEHETQGFGAKGFGALASSDSEQWKADAGDQGPAMLYTQAHDCSLLVWKHCVMSTWLHGICNANPSKNLEALFELELGASEWKVKLRVTKLSSA